MARAYLGLGSNIGDRIALLRAAIETLDWGDTRAVTTSSIYETDPVGGPREQPRFLNQVVAVDTMLGPRALFERCIVVEEVLGRAREHEVRWGPRVIDVDVLLFGQEVIDEPDLKIPHPRLCERAFALVPLAEIAPDAAIPGHGSVADALRALGGVSGVHLYAGSPG